MTVADAALERARPVVFTVYGLPVPQGSKSAINVRGRPVVVENSRATLRPWRAAIAAEAAAHLDGPLEGPIGLRVVFTMQRPKAHYRTGVHAGELRDTAPTFHSTRPDADKLARAVLDALTGVAFRDDGQVAELAIVKRFGSKPGATFELWAAS